MPIYELVQKADRSLVLDLASMTSDQADGENFHLRRVGDSRRWVPSWR